MKKGYKEFLLVMCERCGWCFRERGSVVCIWTPLEVQDQLKETFSKLSSIEVAGYIAMANNIKHEVWIH